ncbi:hypothetical protein E1B28_006280 [Marasmius oreades]|uniref:Transmembrane protein n=1 Tax=Marasmius oreades TaxID=181124 RepID=A0A9P7S6U8_9AGAR|nr:uncharacterized protein E1B28_006280 [Marasmius oreades]KAG7095541.1 hypothetical protein E1B28_006280 [Marasmius oreades]
MVIHWYLVLLLWALVTPSTPVVLPLISDSQDYAELAQQSPSAPRPQSDLVVLDLSSLPSVSPRTVLSPIEPRPLSSTMVMALEPSLPSSISILPLLSYSTILAIIGFISLRIAKWRQRRRARQHAHALDRDGAELLPTSTATISPRFKDFPVPPPLPPNSPHLLPKSASVTSLHSVSSPCPASPALAPWQHNRLSRVLERPKSPIQHIGFSPGAKIKRRSNSLDLGGAAKKRHASVPTPLRHPFFISEPEPEHDHLLPSHEALSHYRDDDDADDDLTLIHFSPAHQRTKTHHGQALWHSSLNTPFASSFGTETALIDFSSSSSLDKPKISTPVKPVSAHTVAWAFDIEVPRTPPPPPSLPLPLVALSKFSLHRRSQSSDINLIDFSERKVTEDEDVGTPSRGLAVKAIALTEEGDMSPDKEKEQEMGYEGGDEDEMDIVWDEGREFKARPFAPALVQREKSVEKDVVDDLQKSGEGLLVGSPLSAVPSMSSSEPAIDLIEESESKENVFDGKVDSLTKSVVNEVSLETPAPLLPSHSRSPVVVALTVDQADEVEEQPYDHSRQEVDVETTLVEEARLLEDLITSYTNSDIGKVERKEKEDNADHELINDLNEFDEDLSYLTTGNPDSESPHPEVDEAFIKVSLPPSPIPSDCDTLLDLDEVEVPGSVDEEVIESAEDVEIPQSSDPLPLVEVKKEEFPDPDLLPLPQIPLLTVMKSSELETSTSRLSSPSPSISPHQIPTPPASPPPSPRLTGLSNITNRPAWSVRAADMPPLGIHANGAHILSTKPSIGDLGGKRNDENWDVVKRRKLGKAKDDRKEEDVAVLDKDEDVEVKPEPAVSTVIVEPSPPSSPTPPPSGLFSPPVSFASLPGAFPTDISTVNEKNGTVVVSVDVLAASIEPQSQVENEDGQVISTSLTAPPTRRRPVHRSALDIALAMQLRPGLGVGADPAWMVRFLMAMFGWFVVLISGSTGDANGYGMASAFMGARRRD